MTILHATGCGNEFGRIDSQMEELMQQRTSLIGAKVAPEYRSAPGIDGLESSSITRKQPATVNPATEQLSYKVADESRDVAARLAAFQAIDESAARRLTLFAALRQAQQTGPEHITAQEQYMLTAIGLMIERHLWGPRFFAESAADYTNFQNDGHTEAALRIINQLRATQRLPYGGEVEARLLWDATENLRNEVTGRYRQASSVALDARIPLLRGAGLFAQEDLIQAERNLIYAARGL